LYVRGQIRRHCTEIDFPSSSPTRHFKECEDGKFYPLDSFVKQVSNVKSHNKQRKTTTRLPSLINQLKDLHKSYNEEVKQKILRGLKSLSPEAFEIFAKKLMEVYGFHSMEVTKVSNDGGIDGHGKLKVGLAEMNVAFQCKRWTKNSIQRPEIDKFREAAQGNFEQGVFFTTSKFSEGAKGMSIKKGAVPIILVDGAGIVDLMINKGLVSKEKVCGYIVLH